MKSTDRLLEKKIYTIGTSVRPPEEFIEALEYYNIERIIDVRHFPTSRFPHFKREELSKYLEENGIEYVYLGDNLGGFRAGGYEAFTKSREFEEGIRYMEMLARTRLSAFICAEKLFWRCHRRFIARALIRRNWEVYHIIEKGKLIKGKLT